MIYEYCLVVERVFLLFSSLSLEAYDFEDSPENQIPNIPLLRVSKQVAHEAEKILYSRNNFVVPIFEDMEKFFSQYLDTPRRNALPGSDPSRSLYITMIFRGLKERTS
jgi:hypothetical protein